MPDTGARYADKQIADIESRITALYETAYSDINRKYMAFVQKFKRDDAKYRQMLADGEITKATYDAWLRGQVFQGKRWKAQLADLAQTLTHTTQTAMDIINDAAPGVFAMNANYAEYEIEKAGNVDCGFGLYDEDTVRRIVRDDPNLLPPSKVDIPLEQQWNQTLINRQIGVGIVTGEGIEAIAKRLQRAANMSANQARTHARTAMTGAQNAGRIEGYHRAENMGIKLEKEWLATLDGHTRHAHAALDGQRVPVDEPFQSELGEIMYPGDPNARPANVYNCRCTLISYNPKYPPQNAMRRPNMQQLGDEEVQKPIKDMTYAEWAGWKEEEVSKPAFIPVASIEEAEQYASKFVSSYKSALTGNVEYKGIDIDYANEMNRALTDVFDKYEPKNKIRNIKPFNTREKRFKDTTAEAAYQWGVGDLFFNKKYLKNEKTMSKHVEEYKSLLDKILPNIDKAIEIARGKTGFGAATQVRYLEALKRTGRTNVNPPDAYGTTIHELGHYLDDQMFRRAYKESGFDLSTSYDKYAGKISAYATSSEQEYVAESFAAYWNGEFDVLDPELVNLFDRSKKK